MVVLVVGEARWLVSEMHCFLCELSSVLRGGMESSQQALLPFSLLPGYSVPVYRVCAQSVNTLYVV